MSNIRYQEAFHVHRNTNHFIDDIQFDQTFSNGTAIWPYLIVSFHFIVQWKLIMRWVNGSCPKDGIKSLVLLGLEKFNSLTMQCEIFHPSLGGMCRTQQSGSLEQLPRNCGFSGSREECRFLWSVVMMVTRKLLCPHWDENIGINFQFYSYCFISSTSKRQKITRPWGR